MAYDWEDRLLEVEKTTTPCIARHKLDLIELLKRSEKEGGAGMTDDQAWRAYVEELKVLTSAVIDVNAKGFWRQDGKHDIIMMHVCAALYRRTASKS